MEQRFDATVRQPTDAVARVVRSAICGSDLWAYGSMPASQQGRPMGHEPWAWWRTSVPTTGLQRGDLVVTPFVWADNTCDFCTQGLQTSCRHGGRYGLNGVDGGQGEAVGVPQAQGTLVKLPVGEDSALLASLLSLSDVFCVGHHACRTARVGPRMAVTVIGDGAVGAVGGPGRQAARCRTDRPHGPPQGAHRPGPRVRRHHRRSRAGP